MRSGTAASGRSLAPCDRERVQIGAEHVPARIALGKQRRQSRRTPHAAAPDGEMRAYCRRLAGGRGSICVPGNPPPSAKVDCCRYGAEIRRVGRSTPIGGGSDAALHGAPTWLIAGWGWQRAVGRETVWTSCTMTGASPPRCCWFELSTWRESSLRTSTSSFCTPPLSSPADTFRRPINAQPLGGDGVLVETELAERGAHRDARAGMGWRRNGSQICASFAEDAGPETSFSEEAGERFFRVRMFLIFARALRLARLAADGKRVRLFRGGGRLCGRDFSR